MAFVLNTDGGSRGNPGPAACGFSLTDGEEVLLSGGWFLGVATNNHAEYCALIWGLENALAHGIRTLEVRADSELMVKQMNGQYRVKNPDMKVLHTRAQTLVRSFEYVGIQHVYRTHNKEADARANQAMDVRGAAGSYLVAFDESDHDTTGTASMF